jgi:RNA polymerase sigma-70 factor (ECF subfamily)
MGQLGALRRYARSLTRDEAGAEDLVHDALVRAYDRKATFRPDRSLRAWLLAIVHNTFVDGVRQRRGEVLRMNRVAETADDAMPPAQEHAVHLAQVREAFMELPDEQRAALHLAAIEGLSYQEAAAALDIPVGTLMSRLGRARAALREREDGTAARKPGRPERLRVVGGTDD